MKDNILVEAMGDFANLRILGFLLEHRYYQYNKSQISELAGVSRETTKKYLPFLTEKEYIIVEGKNRKVYQINMDNPFVVSIENLMNSFVENYVKPTKGRREERIKNFIMQTKEVHSLSPNEEFSCNVMSSEA